MDDYKLKAEEKLLQIKKEAERIKTLRSLILCFSISAFVMIISSLLVYFFTDGKAYPVILVQGTLGGTMAITSLSLYIGYRIERKRRSEFKQLPKKKN